ncbi:MAG TPA: hypothetical protein PLK12_14995, partial [Prolixibacteraceae bacterium]|nr:hypothetical protein [Prolixibacteraceae bacterium]
LGLDLTFSFFDSLAIRPLGPTISLTLIAPPVIDDEGKAMQPAHHTETVALTDEQVDSFKKASRIFFTVRFYLPEGEGVQIRIHPDDYLTLNVGTIVETYTDENP